MAQNKITDNPFASLFKSEEDAKLFKSNCESFLSEEIFGHSFMKQQAEIEDFFENVFQFTISSDRSNQYVFLETFKMLHPENKWLDMTLIEEAVFERLTSENIPVKSPSNKISELASEKDVVKYLYECYKRALELQRKNQFPTITKQCMDKCNRVISQNGRIAFQLAANMFPDTRPAYQFVEILLDATAVGEYETASNYFLQIVADMIDNPEEGSVQSVFKPMLDELRARLNGEYLLENLVLYRVLNVLLFFSTNASLAEVLLSHSQPANISNGKQYESTLLGFLLSVSCIPISDMGPFTYFQEPSRLTKHEVEANELRIQQRLAELSDGVYQLIYNILKLGGDVRHQMLEWIANCLHANKGRAKMWNSQVPMLLVQNYCSDGFFVNLCAVLLRLCKPLAEPCSPKLLKLQPTYCQATTGTREERRARNIHMQELDKETYLIPLSSDSVPSLENNYTFLTEIFFLSHFCFHIGFEVVNDRFVRINQTLHRIQSIYQDIARQGGERSDAGLKIKEQMEKGMSVFLSLKAAMMEEKFISLSSQFLVASATYITQLATSRDGVDSFNMPSYPLTSENISPFLCCLPEFLADNITGFLLFLRRFKDSAYEVMGEKLDHLMTFVLVFMASSDRLKNPHLRAQMAELLEALMPPRDVPTHSFVHSSYYRERIFTNHPLAAVLSEALLTVFVSIEMTGQGVTFEQKFNYRRPMYSVLKYIWEQDIHRSAMQQLAAEAESNMDNQPLFLRFINLLINDATYLLDESLSHMAQIRELQDQRDPVNGEWSRLPPQQRQENEMNYRHVSMLARFHNIMAKETIYALSLITQHIRSIFCQRVLVQRVADMLNYFLLHLVGPKKRNLVVKEKEEFDFKPREVVSHISEIYVNLGDNESFCIAVSQDGRSYSQQLFGQAVEVLQKIHWPPEKILRFEHYANVIKVLADKARVVEDQLADVPDDFLDPIMGTLMTDPVILPSSGKIVDRTTIARHVLSDQTDPFNRQPLNMAMVKPATELLQRIMEWRASQSAADSNQPSIT